MLLRFSKYSDDSFSETANVVGTNFLDVDGITESSEIRNFNRGSSTAPTINT
jgi:hypothetical protein